MEHLQNKETYLSELVKYGTDKQFNELFHANALTEWKPPRIKLQGAE